MLNRLHFIIIIIIEKANPWLFSDLILQLITTAGTFWMYSGFCAFGVIFVIFFVPETKGRDLNSIAKLFAKKDKCDKKAGASTNVGNSFITGETAKMLEATVSTDKSTRNNSEMTKLWGTWYTDSSQRPQQPMQEMVLTVLRFLLF